MKKQSFYLIAALAFVLVSTVSYAQTITVTGGNIGARYKNREMVKVGEATLECIYEYEWVKDTTDRSRREKETMLLHIGPKISKFFSYNLFLRDSILAASNLENILKTGGSVNLPEFNLPNASYMEIYKDRKSGKTLFTDRVASNRFSVEEKTPDFNWTVTGEKKNILGYEVTKATCSFRGRDYTVWFADEIPVPDGPWKFSGLPGLILEAYDTKMEYVYMIKGLKKLDNVPIEKEDGKFISAGLKAYQRARRMYEENPIDYVNSATDLKITVSGSGSNSYLFKSNDLKYDFQEIL